MNKESKKKSKDVVDVVGTPTAILLPARNYKFKVFADNYSIVLPRKGKYTDLDDKLFSEKDGEFDFLQYDEENESFMVFFPILSRLLFGTSQYPDLKEGQAFAPLGLIIKEDSVELIGNIIEMERS